MSVLISIKPKWCEKICHEIGKDETGKPIYEKRIEVRKSAPKEVPFKAYIYCTKEKPYLYRVDDDNNFELTNTLHPKTYEYVKDYNEQNGKVIGEFICDYIYEWEKKDRLELIGICPTVRASYMIFVDDLEKTCLAYDELDEYGKNKALYGWHISDLKIYDKPKELNEFRSPCSRKQCASWCKDMKLDGHVNCLNRDKRFLTRPPQSWQYVEEVK